RRPRLADLVTLCCLLPLAVGSIRMVAWWLLAATPVLAAQLAALLPALQDRHRDERPTVAAAVSCTVLFAVMAISFPWLEEYNPALWQSGKAHRLENDLQSVAEQLERSHPF